MVDDFLYDGDLIVSVYLFDRLLNFITRERGPLKINDKGKWTLAISHCSGHVVIA